MNYERDLINASVQQLNEPQQTFNDVQAFVSKIHGAEKKIKAIAAVRLADPSTTPPLTDPNPLPTDPISTSQQILPQTRVRGPCSSAKVHQKCTVRERWTLIFDELEQL